jgi:hypothetical protein
MPPQDVELASVGAGLKTMKDIHWKIHFGNGQN